MDEQSFYLITFLSFIYRLPHILHPQPGNTPDCSQDLCFNQIKIRQPPFPCWTEYGFEILLPTSPCTQSRGRDVQGLTGFPVSVLRKIALVIFGGFQGLIITLMRELILVNAFIPMPSLPGFKPILFGEFNDVKHAPSPTVKASFNC